MEDLFGNTPIKGLNWKQPFASLMLCGKIETRRWTTSYRGLVLIIASKQEYTDVQMESISGIRQTMRAIECLSNAEHLHNKRLEDTLGKAIAVGRLVDCRPMTQADEDKCFVRYYAPWSEGVKDKYGYSKIVQRRLYCHIYEDVRAIEPFDIKGAQKWKSLLPSEISKIKFI